MHKSLSRTVAVIGVTLLLGLSGSALIMGRALAATGSMYFSPSTASVQNGNNVSLTVRINPGVAVNAVQVRINYDTTKLTYVSYSNSGSSFNTLPTAASASGGTVSVDQADLGGSVSSNSSLIGTVVFTAKVGSGSTSVTLAGSNAASAADNQSTNPSLTSATVTLTSAPATCPAGQTGTPPNCKTPTTGGSGSTGGSSSSGGKTSGGSSSNSSTGSSSPSSSGSTTTKLNPPKVTGQTVQYTVASFTTTSEVATTAYIRYGLNGQLTTTTPVSPSATSHTIALDPTVLVPGETYTYVVYVTNAQGVTSQTAPQTFTTKGLAISFTVFDKNHQPLRSKKITLHSDPQTATTDKNGVAVFTNIAPGNHSVTYADGDKSYTQQVAVASNVVTSGSTQTAEQQNFSIVYDFVQPANHTTVFIWAGVAILIIGLLVVLERTGRLGLALALNNRPAPVAEASHIVVGGTQPTVDSLNPQNSVQQGLNAIPNPATPAPGSTVAPKQPDVGSEHNQDILG